MSAITLNFRLTYSDDEHARLVFEAFSQWPTLTVRRKTPDVRRMKAIVCSMEWLGYRLDKVYGEIFDKQNAILEKPPKKDGKDIELCFYCSKLSGNRLFQYFFDEFTALPVSIEGYFYRDMDGYSESKKVTID